jgi:hypothetical protein
MFQQKADWPDYGEREDFLRFSLSMMIILTLFIVDLMMMDRLLLYFGAMVFNYRF